MDSLPPLGELLPSLAPVLAFAGAALVLLLLFDALVRGARRRWWGTSPAVAAVGDPAVTWRRRRVLNASEALVLAAAEAVAARLDPAWRVWPQVALGEVLETAGRTEADRLGWLRINAKRCDLLLVDGGGLPLAAIEYQGGGHFRGDWAERDATKCLALERAGVIVVEVAAPLARRPEALRRRLVDALAPLAADGSRAGAEAVRQGSSERSGRVRRGVRSARG